MQKPAHLQPPERDGPWIGRRRAAAAALLLGVIAFAVAAIAHGQLSSTPDWRVTVPGFVATAAAAAVSLARREPQGYRLWAAGLALAAAALVLGWFLTLAIVIGAAAIVILILHAVM